MRIRTVRSRIYRLNPSDPLVPVYTGGRYIKTAGMPDWQFRLLTAALCVLSLSALIAAGLRGADTLCFALSYLPCVRALFAVLLMPRGGALREDDFFASVRTVRIAGIVGALLCAAAAAASPLCVLAAGGMLTAGTLGYRQRYLLQKETTH